MGIVTDMSAGPHWSQDILHAACVQDPSKHFSVQYPLPASIGQRSSVLTGTSTHSSNKEKTKIQNFCITDALNKTVIKLTKEKNK